MPKLRRSPILFVMNIALIVYGLTSLLSIVAAYDTTLIEANIVTVVVSVVLYFILVKQLRRLEMTPLFAKILVGLGLVFSLFFISQFAYENYPETPAVIVRFGGYLPRLLAKVLPDFEVSIHQNSAATFIEMLLPIVVALIMMSHERRRKSFWIFTLGVLIYAFVLTFSRGAFLGVFLAALIGVAVMSIRRLSGRQATTVIVGIITALILFVVGLLMLGPHVPFIASLMSVTASRLEIYRNSLVLAGDYLFTGIGLGGTFAMVYSRYALMIFVPLFTYTHNLFLAVLLGQGIIGLAAFLIVILAFYLFVVRVLWVVRLTEIEPIFYGALIGVTATLIHGLTDARQYVESPFNLPLLFAGMALTVASGINALRAEAFEDRTTNRGRGWGILRIIAGTVVVLLVIGFVVFNKPILAAWYTNLGALAETRADSTLQPNISHEERNNDLRIAREEYEGALQIDPDYPNANRRLGNLNVDENAFEQALPLLEKAYAAQPDYPASIKGLGLAYVWLGRTQEASCVLKRLPDVKAMDEELYTWADFRHSVQQDLLAAHALETAAVLENYQQTNLDVWILIGDRYQAAGQPERAQQWYSRVLDKDANNPVAAQNLKTLGLTRIKTMMEPDCT